MYICSFFLPFFLFCRLKLMILFATKCQCDWIRVFIPKKCKWFHDLSMMSRFSFVLCFTRTRVHTQCTMIWFWIRKIKSEILMLAYIYFTWFFSHFVVYHFLHVFCITFKNIVCHLQEKNLRTAPFASNSIRISVKKMSEKKTVKQIISCHDLHNLDNF